MILNPDPRNYTLRNGRAFLALLLLALGLCGLSPTLAIKRSAAGNAAQSKITVAVDLVLVPVKVTDSHGTFVSGLKQEDFQIFEQGQQQKLTVFEVGDVPVTVGLIVDHSRSMGNKIPGVIAAVSSFANLSNPQDEMFVIDFNDAVSMQLMNGKTFSNDPKQLESALRAVSARGQTALYDAVGEGLLHLKYGRWSKKALVIISDGGDNASQLKYSEILAQARQSQALIYAIGLLGSLDVDENPALLQRLCKDTGGIAYFPHQGESVESASTQIAHDLREQYTLGYTPEKGKNAGAFRKIEVKVSAPGLGRLRVRARQGYTPQPEKQAAAQLDPVMK